MFLSTLLERLFCSWTGITFTVVSTTSSERAPSECKSTVGGLSCPSESAWSITSACNDLAKCAERHYVQRALGVTVFILAILFYFHFHFLFSPSGVGKHGSYLEVLDLRPLHCSDDARSHGSTSPSVETPSVLSVSGLQECLRLVHGHFCLLVCL